MNRTEIIEKAINECLAEMYSKAQPPFDYMQMLEDYENGCEGLNEKYRDFYMRHYLSQEEYHEIQEKYIDLYRIHNEWKENADLMIDYLKKGGTKDKYIPERVDEDGFKHPGYRGYEKVDPLKDYITEILTPFFSDCNDLVDTITNKVFELMDNCKDFYCPNREEISFTFSVVNYSPNSNKETVLKYWEDQGNPIEIYDRVVDPESCEYVTVTQSQIEEWKEKVEYYNGYDSYFYDAYLNLIKKYDENF